MERLSIDISTLRDIIINGNARDYDESISQSIYNELKAYRDAEEQGLLLRLPCKVGDTVWSWEYPTRIDEEDGSTWTICDIKRAKVVPKKFHLMMLDMMGERYFATKEEAKKKLAELKGE